MLTREQYLAASRVFRLLYLKTLQSGPAPEALALARQIAMWIPSSKRVITYRWFLGVPKLREWIGDRDARELETEGYEVRQKTFESTLKVFRDDIEDDELGGYRPTIMSLANEVKLLPWRRIMEMLADGFEGKEYGKCFDKYPLFSDKHPTGSNMGIAQLSAGAFVEAKKAMRRQKDVTQGDPLMIEPSHLWYHPELENTVEEILDKQYLKGGESNTNYKKITPLKMLGLSEKCGKWWGLLSMNTGNELKPILWQYKPNGNSFVALDKETDWANFMRRELYYGVEDTGNVAPGFPWYIWGSNGTGPAT